MADEESPRYVLHVPFTATDDAEARRLARVLAGSVAAFPEVDAAEAAVSAEDDQIVQSRLFCNRLHRGTSEHERGRRCVLPAEHSAPCAFREAPR